MRKVIYTVVTGSYEPLRQAPRFPGWDAVAFVDDMTQQSNGWTLKHLPRCRELGNVRNSRLPRILPHKYLDDYDRSLYIDASVTLLKSPDAWDTGAPWLYSDHRDRGTVYDEFAAVQMTERAHPDTLHEQEARYRAAGLAGGITPQNCVIMRDHKNPEVIRVCESWWRHFSEGAPRDQLSLPMAFHECDFVPDKITGGEMDANINAFWKISHMGRHKKNYSGYRLYFMIFNYRGSAISRGLQVGRCLFDRGTRNKVIRQFDIPPIKDSTIVIVKEMPYPGALRELKRGMNKLIFDVCDNEKVTLEGLGENAKYFDGVILPCDDLKKHWQEKGFPIPPYCKTIHHHGDIRFVPNTATGFSPVCISTHTQIPDEVKSLGIDCITQENGWEDLFERAKNYNLHVAVYRDGGQDYRFKPTSKIVTAAACDANIILHRLPANLDLLPPEYPYYVDSSADIPDMIAKCRQDYGTDAWQAALAMIRDARRQTTGNMIAAQYEAFVRLVESGERERHEPTFHQPEPKPLPMKSGKENHIFFHVGLIGRWLEIFQEQYRVLRESGILEESELHVMACGGGMEFEGLQKVCPEAVRVCNTVKGFEFPTLAKAHDLAKNHDGKILYMHTKGASRLPGRGDKWRRYMMAACVGKWRECVAALAECHDIAGCDWKSFASPTKSGFSKSANHGFFAGNFWWSTCEFLRTIPSPQFSSNRHLAEEWIGTGNRKPRVFETSHIGIADDYRIIDRMEDIPCLQ